MLSRDSSEGVENVSDGLNSLSTATKVHKSLIMIFWMMMFDDRIEVLAHQRYIKLDRVCTLIVG